MTKTERELRQEVQRAGLRLAAITKHRRGHFHLRVQAPNGAERLFVAPGSGSDSRGAKNRAADLRRFARENALPPVAA